MLGLIVASCSAFAPIISSKSFAMHASSRHPAPASVLLDQNSDSLRNHRKATREAVSSYDQLEDTPCSTVSSHVADLASITKKIDETVAAMKQCAEDEQSALDEAEALSAHISHLCSTHGNQGGSSMAARFSAMKRAGELTEMAAQSRGHIDMHNERLVFLKQQRVIASELFRPCDNDDDAARLE